MGAIFAPRLRSLKYRLRRRLWEWRRGRLPEEITDRIGAVTLCYRVRTDIGRSLYLTGSFEAAEIALIARILRAGPAGAPAILDVGANIGVHSIALCSLFPDARVVAFEPAAGTRRVLERNIRDNGFAERIRVEACALSSACGSAQFYEMADDAYSSLKDTRRKALLRTGAVPLETLDHYVGDRGIARLDLVKIDVEGFETEVIEGGLATLAALKPDLFVEIYQGTHSNADPARTIGLITGVGYRGWVVKDGALHPMAQHDDRYYNYYFSVRDVPAELARAAGATALPKRPVTRHCAPPRRG
jgi:FkbM family methyltransferase